MVATRVDLLDPAEVAGLGGIEIVAQGVVEGFLAGLHRSPFRGFSYADRLAAALALILLRQRDATGLVTFDDRVRQVVPARVKSGQWTRVVRGLLDTPDGYGTAAEGALRHVTTLLARRGLVVLISDLLLDRELTLTALRYLRHRGHQVIVFHIMDRAELELAGPPEVRFRDPESTASVVVRPRELARAYAATVQREIAAWRSTCRRHGVGYHHVPTDMPFGLALRSLA